MYSTYVLNEILAFLTNMSGCVSYKQMNY